MEKKNQTNMLPVYSCFLPSFFLADKRKFHTLSLYNRSILYSQNPAMSKAWKDP